MANRKQTAALHQPDLTSDGFAAPTLTADWRGRGLHILRMKQVIQRTGLSRATLYALISTDPTFPRKISLTARAVGFFESDVDMWLVVRAQSRATA